MIMDVSAELQGLAALAPGVYEPGGVSEVAFLLEVFLSECAGEEQTRLAPDLARFLDGRYDSLSEDRYALHMINLATTLTPLVPTGRIMAAVRGVFYSEYEVERTRFVARTVARTARRAELEGAS